MKIPYRKFKEYIPIDMEELRPKGSYKKLIEKRTHSIDDLILKYKKIPEDLLIARKCPTCNTSSFKKLIKKDHMNIVQCDACELVYTNPIFDDEHYKSTYKSKDYQEIVKDLGEESHNYRVERFGNERINILKNYLKNKDSVKYLDVGCSTGFVVEAAQNNGWEATGIDLNPSAIEFGKSKGLDLRNNALDEISFSEKYFDIISLFDVLEHLTNPKEIIDQALHYLNKDGLLFIYVPNWDSASRLLMGDKAHFIWPTHHLNYYTPDTIKFFLENFGLKIEYITTEGLDIVDYIWREEELNKNNMDALQNIVDKLQFFINAGGYGKNLRVIARKK